MTHKVGITANMGEREDYWRNQYPSLRNWEIQAAGLTYEQAQSMEQDFINNGHEGSPGGRRVSGPVYIVYTFQY